MSSDANFQQQSDELRNLYITERNAINQANQGGYKEGVKLLNKKNFVEKAKRSLKFGTASQTAKRAEEFFAQRTRSAITAPLRRKRKYSTVWTRRVQDQVQMDLWDIGEHKITLDNGRVVNEYGTGINYGLFVAEVKSRKVWGKLLRTKTSEEISQALRGIFQDMQVHGRFGPPKSVLGDNDFNSNIIRTFFAGYGIDGDEVHISNPKQRMKNVIVERFIRTFRNKLAGLDIDNFGDNFPHTFRRIIEEYNRDEHSTTNSVPNEVFTGEEQSMQGMPALKRGTQRGGRFSRKGFRKRKSSMTQQILNPLNEDGVGKTGWTIGEYVRVWQRPEQLDKFKPKENDPKWEGDIYQIIQRYKSKQTFLVRKLILHGADRGLLGDWYRGNNRIGNATLPVPLRGWEMKKVTIDNEELRQWLEFKRQRDNNEFVHDPRPVRRPANQLGRRDLAQRIRRVPQRLNL